MRALVLFVGLLALLSCGNKKEIADPNLRPTPAWVVNRPISGAYYTGVGLSQKSADVNFQRTAKDNALSDLASEIKVNVNANSLLYTLEKDYKIQQEFQENIRTATNLNLEDYEVVDNWEDATTYWVYYRLDKAAYAAKLAAQKRTAQALAIDFLSRAETAASSGQFAVSVDYYLRGLQAIESFWNEENRVDYKQSTILLDNALFAGLKQILNDVRIVSERAVTLEFKNKFKGQALAQFKTISDGTPLEGVPVITEYFGAYGRVRNRYITNTDGRIEIPISQVDSKSQNQQLSVQVDCEKLFEPFQTDPFLRKLINDMRSAEAQIPIAYVAPAIYISSVELNLGKPMSGAPVVGGISNSLSRQNVRFVDKASAADMLIKVNADTKPSGVDQGFYTAILTYSVVVEDPINGEKRFQFNQSNVKGVDLTYEKAGLKAYQNLTRNLESEFMRKLATDLF